MCKGSIKNVFDEGELNRDSVVANYATTAVDGKTYKQETARRHDKLQGRLRWTNYFDKLGD